MARTRRKTPMKNSGFLLAAAIFAVVLVPASALAQSDSQELRKQLDELREQMNKLQARLGELESSKGTEAAASVATAPAKQEGTIQSTQPLPQAPPSKQVGGATATRRTFSEDNVAAARFDNVPLDPKYKGFFRLPGTQDILKIGGYFKTDFIYDLKPA